MYMYIMSENFLRRTENFLTAAFNAGNLFYNAYYHVQLPFKQLISFRVMVASCN